MNQATKTKYRPVLTASQINKILELAKCEQPMSDTSFTIVSTLAPFKAKIENAGIVPAYTEKDKKPGMYTLEGLGEPTIEVFTGKLPESAPFTKEELWEQCYLKWVDNPTSCSLAEIEGANEHRYLHNLMSPKEAEVFEKGMTSVLKLPNSNISTEIID